MREIFCSLEKAKASPGSSSRNLSSGYSDCGGNFVLETSVEVFLKTSLNSFLNPEASS